jgi:hypothetical protein
MQPAARGNIADKWADFLSWCQPFDVVPQAPPAKPNPKVAIVYDSDPVTSWKLTLAAMTRLCDGNEKRALDLLYGNNDACQLWSNCQQAYRAQKAGRAVKVSVNPGDI